MNEYIVQYNWPSGYPRFDHVVVYIFGKVEGGFVSASVALCCVDGWTDAEYIAKAKPFLDEKLKEVLPK